MAQKHIKVYREFFGIGDQDIQPPCELCGKNGIEIHHITSRGLKSFECIGVIYDDINDILNLIGLCRDCHNKAHGGELSKENLYKIHYNRILLW